MDTNHHMKRRKLIKLSAFVATGTAFSGLLPGCKTDSVSIDIDGYTPSLMSSEQYTFIRDFADTLLPETDTVGALSVGLPQIYDTILNNILTSEQQSKHSERLSLLINTISKETDGKSFSSLGTDDKLSILKRIDTKFADSDNDASKAYKQIKNRLIQYYLKTEEVGTNLLAYLPVPGEYQACISLEEAGGKAWAL